MFELDFEWESAPGVASSSVAATWARLELKSDGKPLSRFWSEPTQAVRKGTYSSLLPLASWAARNWWVLLNEGPALRDSTRGPRAARSTRAREWFRRHNFLFAREGMAYPDLSIMRVDDQIGLMWRADPSESTVAGRFIDSGAVVLPTLDVASELRRVIEAVLERVDGSDEVAVEELKADWQAVRASMADEPELCARIGTLGLDPYDEAVEALEGVVEELEFESLLVTDLLATSTMRSLTSNAKTVRDLRSSLRTEPTTRLEPAAVGVGEARAYAAGFSRAHWLRSSLGLSPDDPIKKIDEIVVTALGSGFEVTVVEQPEADVQAVVEANGASGAVLGGRGVRSMRFHLARVVHHALFATSDEHPVRLLTRSHDWQQSASRSFAAELLAPRSGLEARIGDAAWIDEAKLAREFNVGVPVIRHQLENHGLA